MTALARRAAVAGRAILILASALPVRGEIAPSEVLLIANHSEPESLRLARLYAQGRQIPDGHLLLLTCDRTEQITASGYETQIAGPIRDFLGRPAAPPVRLLVTFYGIPLKIAAASPTPAQREAASAVRDRYLREFAALEDTVAQLETLAGQPAASRPASLPARAGPEKFHADLPALVKILRGVIRRLGSRLAELSGQARTDFLANVTPLRLRLEGPAELLFADPRTLTPREPALQPQINDYLRLRRELEELVNHDPLDRSPEQTYRTALLVGGQIALLQTLAEDHARLVLRGSAAAVDSELTLVRHRGYVREGKIPNALNPRLADHPAAAAWKPVLMVARLDGPDPATVERMIRDALAAEAKGLAGRAYIDTRARYGRDPFGVVDEDLRRLGERLEKTALSVTVDRTAEVFPPGSCPDAALYCGWYSLRNYVPAFTFVPGAIAWHIASFEATSLHGDNTTEWCPRLLQAGAAATLGPVAEPYLDAFPAPSEFFGLLLSGKYCLVEAFFLTKPYNSWRMVLLGDPLYRPFARNPQGPAPELKTMLLPVRLIP